MKMLKQKFAVTAFLSIMFWTQTHSAFASSGNGQVVNITSTSSPDYKASVLCNQSLMAMSNKQWDEAKALLEEACMLDPNQASCMVHTNLALVMEHFNKFDEAHKHLTLALKFSPNDKSALVDTGSYYQQMGDIAKASSYFQKYLSLYPDAPDAVTLRQLLWSFKRANVTTVDEKATNYLKEATGAKPVRFDKKILNVYFEPATGVTGFHNNYAGILNEALDQWTQASKMLTWITVADKNSADIVCKWVDSLLDANGKPTIETGQAETRASANTLKLSLILLSTLPLGDTEVNDSTVKYMCLHEVGHALGLRGHSPHKEDIMFFSERAIEKPELSDRDKNTIEKLYQ
jgi:tetratricopeptide (TPR) repeat protein